MFAKSLAVRHLSCGSCNGCEHELLALSGPDYDITALGWDFVASPRHADAITVTGPMTDAMRGAALATVRAVPQPRIVIAIGDCATGDGPWADATYSGAGASVELGATIEVRGCPPSPTAIRDALAEAAAELDRVSGRRRR
jgi:Ni,Fe-hydrogenase III small subunit